MSELQDGSIDAGLHVLSLITPRGVELSRQQIAEVCGCNQSYIRAVEERALRKLRAKIEKSSFGFISVERD